MSDNERVGEKALESVKDRLPEIARQLIDTWISNGEPEQSLPTATFLQGALEELIRAQKIPIIPGVALSAGDILNIARKALGGETVLKRPLLNKWLNLLLMEPPGTSDLPSGLKMPEDKGKQMQAVKPHERPAIDVNAYYIRWWLDTEGDDRLPEIIEQEKTVDIVARAWDHWLRVTRYLLVRFADSESDANVVIRRGPVNGGVAIAPVAGPGKFADLIVTVDLNQIGDDDKERFEAVVAHEFGHVLGLGHSGVAGSLMSATIPNQLVAAPALGNDDIKRIQGVFANRVGRVKPPAGPPLIF